MIYSDWHIHSYASYDSTLSIEEIARESAALGLKRFGITDHINYNEPSFLSVIRDSREALEKAKAADPTLEGRVTLGVELTPIAKPEFDYLAIHKSREGFEPPCSDKPYDIELAVSKEELIANGYRYAVCASHWRVDVADKSAPTTLDGLIREWHRQQMWLATDERTTVLGHPWYNGRGAWYSDFSVIPQSMHDELASALLESNKYVECNLGVICSHLADDRFSRTYAEYLRYMFERGLRITYGSDSHNRYNKGLARAEEYLRLAGFKDGDFSDISEEDMW